MAEAKDGAPRGARWLHWGCLTAVMALGAALRFYGLADESAWCDEALTLRHLPAESLRCYLRDAFAEDPRLSLWPLYYIVQYGWSQVAGNGLTGMRLLPVFLGLGSIILVYILGRSMYGGAGGLWAAWAFAVSLVQIYYAQEMRFYALLNLLALASMAALWRAQHGNARPAWALHLLLNALILWTHGFSPLFFAAQGAWLLIVYWRRWRPLLLWGAAHGALAAAFVVWAVLSRYDLTTHAAEGYNDMPPGWRELINAWVLLSGGRFSNANPAAYLPGGVSFDLFIAVLPLLAGAVLLRDALHWDAERPRQDGKALCLLLCWAAIPLLGLFIISLCWRPIFFPRYILYSAAPFSLLLGAWLGRPHPTMPRVCMAVVVCAVFGWQNLALPRPFRADYQAAARIMMADAEQAEIHVLKHFNALGMDYALGPHAGRMQTHEGFDALCDAVAGAVLRDGSAWAVFYRWDRMEAFVSRMEAQGIALEEHTLAGMPPLTIFHLRGSPTGLAAAETIP